MMKIKFIANQLEEIPEMIGIFAAVNAFLFG